MESNFHQWASSFAPIAIGPDDPISVDKYKKCLQSMRPEVALFITKLAFYGDQRNVLEKVVIPCTIIQTTNDKAAPISVRILHDEDDQGEINGRDHRGRAFPTVDCSCPIP
ncbi:hypothetical protein Acr_12g0008080 [Actinidia rufa]|uniref:Uncharacterized protein n=1 Tax=Actinidia rufa TaxID=165716 RepID=A0A7J0FK28_9ERIC|nr:hypothetical protein Acr_12g0008080 [Actinidia rufa]